jgi:hypothetical protein
MLNELSIPDSVQSIGDSAFLNCFSLRRLTFGSNSKLASIGENALPYGLTTFTIPKNVTSIGTGNFTHAWEVLNLSSATVPFSPTSEHAQLITSAASSRVIEENGFVFFTTAEGEGVLIGCNVDAAQITIPSHYTYQSRKVTVIGIADYAIRSCLSTEKVVLSSGAEGSLKAFSVVCGSYSRKEGAENIRQSLVDEGYSAIVVQNPATGLYRVVCASCDTKEEAAVARDKFKAAHLGNSDYQKAWLLYNK